MEHMARLQIHPNGIVFIKVERSLIKRSYRHKHCQPQCLESNINLNIFRESTCNEVGDKIAPSEAIGSASGLFSDEPDLAPLEVG